MLFLPGGDLIVAHLAGPQGYAVVVVVVVAASASSFGVWGGCACARLPRRRKISGTARRGREYHQRRAFGGRRGGGGNKVTGTGVAKDLSADPTVVPAPKDRKGGLAGVTGLAQPIRHPCDIGNAGGDLGVGRRRRRRGAAPIPIALFFLGKVRKLVDALAGGEVLSNVVVDVIGRRMLSDEPPELLLLLHIHEPSTLFVGRRPIAVPRRPGSSGNRFGHDADVVIVGR